MSEASTTRAHAAGAHDETPLYFPAGENRLFGVLTSPPGRASGMGVLLLAGGVYVLSTNRNRVFVRLARELAGLGHHVLRMDFRGVGESAGTISSYDLANPNVEDVRGAMDVLQASGVSGVIVVGSCFGARAGLAAAADHPLLSSMVLFSPPVRASADEPLDPAFHSGLRTLHDRRIPTLVVYGTEDPYYQDFPAAARDGLAHLLQQGTPIVQRTIPGHAHSLQHIRTQDDLVAEVVGWCGTRGH